jgi:PEP-CTERM/exosortase A-associated glycosyltransferase
MRPVVVTSPTHGKSDRPLERYEEINGIRYYRTGRYNRLTPSMSLLVRLAFRYMYAMAYGRCIRWVALKENATILHAHSSYLNGVRATRVARTLGLPCVYEVRGLWQDTACVTSNIDRKHWKYRFIEHMDRKAMHRADRVVTISAGLRRELMAKGVPEEKIDIVPNGVDADIFTPHARDKELAGRVGVADNFVIGFAGMLRRIEGLDIVIEVLPALMKHIPNLKVLFIGGGDDAERLQATALRLGVADHVIFTGMVDHASILAYYSLIDVCVYPRIDARVNHIVTPLKPLEAMAMEKCVVASNVGGLAELVRDGQTGLLFRVGAHDDFLRCCLSLVENAELRARLGAQAREWVVRERDWRSLVARYRETYEKLRQSCTR